MSDSSNTRGDEADPARVREAVKDLFARVLECRESSDIEGANDELARAAPEVRAQVERLLGSHARASGLLQESTPLTASLRIPGYEVGAEIGRGGFGVVYEGRQRVPVDRPVALKVLKIDRATPQVVARFREEARALGRLDHPNIAKILDAGLDSAQRPFVSLELVRGVPLVRYFEEHRTALRVRVELMAQVCRAVHHAHQRAVIHRDLKPANILVEETEQGARARVIDFGIAKIVEESEEEGLTRAGSRLGTPRYMSPEQHRAASHADVRSDVYSLGAVLCEAITGGLPPERPGGVLRPSALAKADAAGELRGDLDAIVMRATASEPDDRYTSAAAMAQDLERYLAGLPVSAAGAGWWYVGRKFVSRHRWATAFGAVAAISVAGGAIVAGLAARQSARERDRSDRMVSFVLEDMIDGLDPDKTGGKQASLQEALRTGAVRAGERLGGDAELVMETLERIGRAQITLTDHLGAALTFERAANVARESLGAEAERSLRFEYWWRKSAWRGGITDGRMQVFSSLRERVVGALGARHPLSLRVRTDASHIVGGAGWLDELRAVEREWEAIGMGGTQEHVETLGTLGQALRQLEDPGALEVLERAARVATDGLGAEHSLAVMHRLALARGLEAAEEDERAEPVLREVMETAARVQGDGSVTRRVAMYLLAEVLGRRGAYEEAKRLAREHLELTSLAFGAESVQEIVSQRLIGDLAAGTEDWAVAEGAYRAALQLGERHWGKGRAGVLDNRVRLAGAVLKQGRLEEAMGLLPPVVDGLPAGHAVRVKAVELMAGAMEDRAVAARLLREEIARTPDGEGKESLRRKLEEVETSGEVDK
ncbi:MAG: protein kinase domain-containing protein [Phycisphaerales bacterium]